jgi:hypothetical protein
MAYDPDLKRYWEKALKRKKISRKDWRYLKEVEETHWINR